MIKHTKRITMRGYTLAEIVVVMLIIAVVVGVSIKITKAKLDSVISYTYYAAYSTLRSATSEMIADYDPNKDAYTYQRRFFDMFNLTPEAIAANQTEALDKYDTIDCSIRTNIPTYDSVYTASILPSLNTDLTFLPTEQVTQTAVNTEETGGGGGETGGEENGACAGKIVACSSDKYYNYDKCACVPKKATIPKTGEKFCTLLEEYVNIAGGTSICNGSAISANTTDFSDKTPDLTLRNGLRIYGLKGDYAAIPMLAGNNIAYNTDLSIGDRIVILVKKLKRDVVAYTDFMKSQITAFFRDMWSQPAYARCAQVNIMIGQTCAQSGGKLCDGSIHEEDGCFRCCTPKLCNVSDISKCSSSGGTFNLTGCYCSCPSGTRLVGGQCIVLTPVVPTTTTSTNTPTTPTSSTTPTTPTSSTTSTGGTPAPAPEPDPFEGVNINEVGYIVYIDVDGSKGNSTLWDDVYPFYITMSGRVVPAFDSAANPDGAGADSVHHLQVSVKNETINANGRRAIKWLAKSVSFREGACLAGFVSSNTPYCSGMSYNNTCSSANSNCQVKPIKPMKLF